MGAKMKNKFSRSLQIDRTALAASVKGIFIGRLKHISDGLAVAMFALLFVIVVAQVVARYVFNQPFGWSAELASVAFIWVIFWVVSFVLPIRRHVVFDIVYQSLSPGAQRVCSFITSVFFAAIFIATLPKTYEYFVFVGADHTAAMEITYRTAFLPYFIFAVVFPARLILHALRLLGKNWRHEIEERDGDVA